jgi:hypothetical protein
MRRWWGVVRAAVPSRRHTSVESIAKALTDPPADEPEEVIAIAQAALSPSEDDAVRVIDHATGCDPGDSATA